jgi:tRNA-dihydrouridine synthase B
MTITPTKIELKPFTIGDIVIDTPLTLAPMAGHTNYALRSISRELGDCGLVCTELLSSHAMYHPKGLNNTLRLFDWREDESPFAVQIFGTDTEIMANAARTVVEYGADIVDINMGCWVPKIAKKGRGAGAALLRDVDNAARIVRAVVEAVDVPVTVKIRNGWQPDEATAVSFAIAAEQAGVKAIAVHGRFATQGFKGDADWDYIRQVKEAVTNIPVIGNGDVRCTADAIHMMELTGCDGVMIGRAAMGNPWIFRQIAHEIRTGQPLPEPTFRERAEMAIHQAKITLENTNFPELKTVRELRGQLVRYTSGMPGATSIRDAVVHANSLEDIEQAFYPILKTEEA